MNSETFEHIKEQFREANIDEKIEIYVSSEGCTQEQYRELLKMFPTGEIPKLEAALNAL